MSSKNNMFFTLQALHKEVTGSCMLLTIHFPNNTERKFLIDCGIYQEIEYEDLNRAFDFNINEIDAVFITHPHVDHIGRIPYLTKLGYNGPIYCNQLTKSISEILLENATKIFQSEYEKERKLSKNTDLPLYTMEDVEKAISLIKIKRLNEPFEIFEGVFVTFLDNGHLLSSSSIYIESQYKNRKPHGILFSGDFKKSNLFKETLEIPENIKNKKNINLVVESTLLENYSNPAQTFENDIIKELNKNQSIFILSLSQERLETILYSLKKIENMGYDMDIWVDSPLGISIMDIYQKYSCIDFCPKNLNLVSTPLEREILKAGSKKRVIISSSGMADAGNAPYYLESFLPRNDFSIFFTSYLSKNSLGRKVIETSKGGKIRIFPYNEPIKVLANIFQTREFSSHGGPAELLDFINMFSSISNVFINHGSLESQRLMKNLLSENEIRATILGTEEIHKITNLGDVFSISLNINKDNVKKDENRPSKYSHLENRTVPLNIRKSVINNGFNY